MSIYLILRMFIPQLIKRFSRSTRSGLKGYPALHANPNSQARVQAIYLLRGAQSLNSPLGKGGCGGRAGKKSDSFHSDEVDGSRSCSFSLAAGVGEYTGVHSNCVFALRNSITGIQSPTRKSSAAY